MKRRILVLYLVGLLALLAGITAALASPAGYELTRSVFGSGGGFSQAAPYANNGTIGQPVVGINQAAPYELCSGFWCGSGSYDLFMPAVLKQGG